MILLVGTNPRLEASVFNARLRKRWMAGALKVGVIGEQADLTYGYEYLGAGPQTLSGLTRSKSDFVKAPEGSQGSRPSSSAPAPGAGRRPGGARPPRPAWPRASA